MKENKRGNNNNPKVIMPPDRKVVNMHNEPQESAPDQAALDLQAKIIGGLRDMAQQIDDGTISCPEFVMIIPKLNTGDLPLIYLGDPIPTIMLEAILHRLVIKMAMV